MHVLLIYPDANACAAAKRLEADAGYKKAAADYLAAKKDDPAFDRIESWLLLAFARRPADHAAGTRSRASWKFAPTRTTAKTARAKVDMFNDGEIGIFPKCGFENVFFGETLVGSGLPSLKYMLAAPDMAANEAGWKTFLAHPDFVRMKRRPQVRRYDAEITKLFLEPTDYSQI